MNITISDLSKMTGLAKSTISGVLNNKDGFSEKTRQKVLQTAAQYGYVPNEIARGLTSRFTKTIGLLIKDITNPFYNHITKGVQEVAAEHGYTVFLCSSGEDHKMEVEQIQAMVGKRVDGLIIAPLLEEVSFDHIYALKRKKLPFVLLGNIPGLDCDTVEFDDYSGGKQVTEYLLQKGHTQIGFIKGLNTSKAGKLRFAAFQDTLLAHSITTDPKYIFKEAKSLSDGFAIGNQLIAMEERPTALVCFDDVIAMGVIKAFENAGLKVPENLSVTGFDDIELAIFPLTTVSIPTLEAGKALARTLIDRIMQERVSKSKHIVFEQKLIPRASVKQL
ncbi:substrate-binding domain-containing protein [Paenibacillus sp. LMG 31456]|uniref:Substrate-binding domain-containing protein n=1 Tax=Paenibacillus foliorum TaxID=2654974 RepID=A0A972H2D4_9BACL|nr:LacI family DNA-binding transcriptional regulator [Paenibacillus foliorum]NOU94981.1 substrate-binding domain-containing protein [Paenibacillus foliorum]